MTETSCFASSSTSSPPTREKIFYPAVMSNATQELLESTEEHLAVNGPAP